MSAIKVVLCDLKVIFFSDPRRTTNIFRLRCNVAPQKADQYFDQPKYFDLLQGRVSWPDFCEATNQLFESQLGSDLIEPAHSAHIYAADEAIRYLVRRLQLRGIDVVYVANTCPVEWNRYVDLAPWLLPASPNVWRSDREHNLKERPGVFAKIISEWIPEHLKIAPLPHEVLLIDHESRNCQAAKADPGMKALWYCKPEPWLLEKTLLADHLI